MEELKQLSKKRRTNMANQNFENKMKQLEELISKLEDTNLSLQDSIAIYESAMKLSKELSLELQEATKKIKMISEDGEITNFQE